MTSGKDGFSGGADLTMLQVDGREYARRAGPKASRPPWRPRRPRQQLNLVYRRLETCGKPFAPRSTASAWAAASNSRSPAITAIASDSDKTRVGLPEIKVGLFPGGGGTQRVARLMPTPDALQMLFKGEQIKPAAAKKMGLVHEVAPAAEIVAARQGLGEGEPQRQGALGRSEIQAAVRQGVLAGRHDDLAAGQCDLSPRDLRQLSGGEGDPFERVRGPATADGSRARGREQAISPISFCRRKRRR